MEEVRDFVIGLCPWVFALFILGLFFGGIIYLSNSPPKLSKNHNVFLEILSNNNCKLIKEEYIEYTKFTAIQCYYMCDDGLERVKRFKNECG